MKPILFEFGPLTFYSYGLMVAIAFVVTYALLKKRGQALGYSEAVIAGCMFAVFFGGIVGGRAYYVIQYWSYFRQDLLQTLWLFRGGLVWYGGFIGGLVCGIGYARARKLPVLRVADLFAPYIALGQVFGRVGCFLNGCCFGFLYEGPAAVHYPDQAHGRFPNQPIEAALLVVLYLILTAVARRDTIQTSPGRTAACYLIGYGLIRFHMEFLRGDQPEFALSLSLAQWISLVLVAAGGLGLSHWFKNRKIS